MPLESTVWVKKQAAKEIFFLSHKLMCQWKFKLTNRKLSRGQYGSKPSVLKANTIMLN